MWRDKKHSENYWCANVLPLWYGGHMYSNYAKWNFDEICTSSRLKVYPKDQVVTLIEISIQFGEFKT